MSISRSGIKTEDIFLCFQNCDGGICCTRTFSGKSPASNYVTNEIGLILGANFGTSSSEMTVTTTGANPTATLTEESVTNFGISLDANYHFKALYSVSPYIGVNVNIGSKSGSRDSSQYSLGAT